MNKRKKNLILTGGIRHNFKDNTKAIDNILSNDGFDNKIEENIFSGIKLLNNEKFDLVTIMALRWKMTNDKKYEPYREKWGLELTENIKKIFENYIYTGGGLLALHTACICFDDWFEWKQILGGVWEWNKSFHPKIGPLKLQFMENKSEILKDIKPFDIVDELYSNLSFEKGIKVIVSAKTDNNSIEPVVWTNNYGKGKVVCNILGHDTNSILNSNHKKLIINAANWALS